MTRWTSEELERISEAEELNLAALRPNGTLRRPVTIWVVRSGDDLYVRSWRGRDGAWFRGARETHEGHISAGGVEKDVTFIEADEAANADVNAAYRTKYARYADSYVEPMVRPEAQETTLKLAPRSPGGAE